MYHSWACCLPSSAQLETGCRNSPWILDETRLFVERGRNPGLLPRIVDIWVSVHHLGQTISDIVLGNMHTNNCEIAKVIGSPTSDTSHAHISGVSLRLCVSNVLQDFVGWQWKPGLRLARDCYRDKSDRAS